MHPNDGRVISNFIAQALHGQDITVYGDGSQTRSFCYVDDMTEALVKFVNTPDGFTGPLNVGNPNEFTIMEIAEKVVKLTSSKSKIAYNPLPPYDQTQRQPDISLAQEKLKWEPVIPIEEGLKKTIAYFTKLLEGNAA